MLRDWVAPLKKVLDYLSFKEGYEKGKFEMFKGNHGDFHTRFSSMCLGKFPL